MVQIRRVGVLRTASVLALLYGLAALVFFGILAIFVLLAGVDSSGFNGVPGFNAGVGAVGILIFGLVLAVVYGVLGWVFTAVFCLLYNVVAGFTGGVAIQLEAKPVPTPPVAPQPAATPPAPPPTEPPTTTS
jgi:hypothetical protein